MITQLPFLSGVYSTGPGLVPLSKNGLPDNRIFDVDEEYRKYISNKDDCRKELGKYFCTKDLAYDVELAACLRIARELARSYPEHFSLEESQSYTLHNRLTNTSIVWTNSGFVSPGQFLSLFDAMANQVQEDLAIFRMNDERDWLAAIHLCSPNHWDPREKIGRHFQDIHLPVPAMERTVSQYKPMLLSVINKGPFARYAWGVDTDNILNHHPAGPNRRTPPGKKLFIRMERQHLIGLPKVSAFVFTIRTYFYAIDQLDGDQRKGLASAIRSMTPASVAYKRMSDYVDDLLNALDETL